MQAEKLYEKLSSIRFRGRLIPLGMKIILIVICCLLIILGAYCFLYIRWRQLWHLDPPRKTLRLVQKKDDTLRVIMIGDSWAGMHNDTYSDHNFEKQLFKKVMRPVSFKSRGKGGAKTREIYQLLFEREENGFKSLLSEGADYCIVVTGINDAAANLGTKQYLYYYKLIIDFMLINNIRPVIIEIPDVDIWNIYSGKPYKDLFVDYLRSCMTRSKMYNYIEYRESLSSFLEDNGLKDKVLYVQMSEWNIFDNEIDPALFLSDRIHLNTRGYEKLDSCIVNTISDALNDI